jgi:hypothetical protein
MRIKEGAGTVALGLTLLAALALFLHEHGIRQRLEANGVFSAQAGLRFAEVLERMNRLSSTPGADLRPFQEIAESELRNLQSLDRERETLRGELWLSIRRR